jgi:tetratricopeptide (TPR) repeat protein
MKCKISFVLTLAALLSCPAFAGSTGNCENAGTDANLAAEVHGVQKEVNELIKNLKLTPRQYYTLFTAYHGRMDLADRDVYSGALEYINSALKKSATAELYAQKAGALSMLGRNREAIDSYTMAMKRDPANPQYPMNRASAYLDLKEYEKALADAAKAIELDHDAAGFPYHTRYRIYREMSDYNNAAKDLSSFLAITTDKKFRRNVMKTDCFFLVTQQGRQVKGCPAGEELAKEFNITLSTEMTRGVVSADSPVSAEATGVGDKITCEEGQHPVTTTIHTQCCTASKCTAYDAYHVCIESKCTAWAPCDKTSTTCEDDAKAQKNSSSEQIQQK